ncbi:MAG: Arc family DNA-binding protein [Bradymonadaceae bacterium]
MATLTVRDVPEELYEKLMENAERHRRSLNKEAIVCLERALETHRVDPSELRQRARALRDQAEEVYVTDDDLREAREEGRS